MSKPFQLEMYNSMSRQAIINGNFDVWQRGTSFAASGGGSAPYTADRWRVIADGTTTYPTITISRQVLDSGTIPNSFYYLRLNTSGTGISLGANSYYFIRNYIENGLRYLCGQDKKVTVSFWARSDIPNKRIGFYLAESFGTGGSPSVGDNPKGKAFTLTTSWKKYTATINSLSSTTYTLVGKTFGTNNDDCLGLNIIYQWGSNVAGFVGETTAETFGGAGNIDIAQVQLCADEVTLPFQPKSFEEELRACMRYYERWEHNPAINFRFNLGSANYISSTELRALLNFKVEKRIPPTISQGGGFRLLPSGAGTNLSFIEGTRFQVGVQCSGSGFTSGTSYYVQTQDSGGWIAADAEL